MPQYLISTYLPDDFDPSQMTEQTIQAIHALNRELIAAGVRRFACGLSPKAVTVRSQADGEAIVTDGPYLETKEYVGGLSILETENIDQALAWVRKGARVIPGVVEVREIFFNPAPAEDCVR
ncbi:YciI family protein [Dyella sp. A6]|uniref:YciI family protein n=1 Tax=Dyella aluminiiresistens TaxID=3069105 RepID=UPI002E79D221|nr:YciI family protein [Dyella sp. A6]